MSGLASENVRRPLPKKLLAGVLLVLVALGVGGGLYFYYAYWRETPRHALWQMVRAIQANDMETLFRYVDIPSIADHLVTDSAGELDAWLLQKGLGAAPGEDDVSRLARSLTKKFARFLTPKLIGALEPQIKAGVEKYLGELSTMEKAGLAALPAKAEIEKQNGVAVVTFTDPNNGQKFRFRMARLDDASPWRVVAIDYQDFRALLGRKFGE